MRQSPSCNRELFSLDSVLIVIRFGYFLLIMAIFVLFVRFSELFEIVGHIIHNISIS